TDSAASPDTRDAAADSSATDSGTDSGADSGEPGDASDEGFVAEGSGCKCDVPGTAPRREMDVLALGAGLAGLVLMRRRRKA
ncbi:MAG: hypothetical protein ABI175_03620, partial [Polyangiales bacterium]